MKNKLLSTLVVLLCIVLLGGAVVLLLRAAPQKKPDNVTSLETGAVFDRDETVVEPEREQEYDGEVVVPAVDEEPAAPAPEEQTPTEPAENEAEDAALAQAQAVLDGMTLEEKVWQLFFVTPESLTGVQAATLAGEATKTALEEMPVGGIVYFSKNIESIEQTRNLLDNTQSYVKIPLFLGVDEEGGSVSRVASNPNMALAPIASMAEFGAQGDAAALYSAITQTAAGLAELGFNLNFAPVADVAESKNAVIGDRSFGTDPALCASMVSIAVGAMEDSGVVSCLKHFPGYGSASADDHNGPAEVMKTLDELEACDLLPFAAGIEKGVPFIMVSHLSVPAITGGSTPCDLSYLAITETLRNKMGYENVIITDAQDMDSITGQYSAAEAAVKALSAGADMILMPDDLQAACQGVMDALKNGELSEQRIEESVLRVLRVKAQYGLLDQMAQPETE